MRTEDLISEISMIPRDSILSYANPNNKNKIRIIEVVRPYGPIYFKRYKANQKFEDAKKETISIKMISRLASALDVDVPINVDRVLGASYNTRSILEAILLHTENVWLTYPDRIENGLDGMTSIKKGHKHIILLEKKHKLGDIFEHKTDILISESKISSNVLYRKADIEDNCQSFSDQELNDMRRHSQIQVALLEIGGKFGLKSWVASNDHQIIYKNEPIKNNELVLDNLHHIPMFNSFDCHNQARLIDLIWFEESLRNMPAVFEVEHSTGILSGLTRMKTLKDRMPPLSGVKWVIASSSDMFNTALKHANTDHLKDLNALFLSYESIEELYSLTTRRNIREGIKPANFLESFCTKLVD